jgi:hypothetical protein
MQLVLDRTPISKRTDARTLHDVACYVGASDGDLSARIRELEGEWALERVFEAKAASLSLLGLALGMTVDRRFLALPLAAAAALLQLAFSGWSPPFPLLRTLGLRTAAEIQQEILALRILRGDFIERPVYPESLLAAAEPNY